METKFNKWLKEISAPQDMQEWAAGKSFERAYETCENAEWMMWWFVKLNNDRKLRVLVAAKCAETVKPHHLKSKAALEMCFKYAKGEATQDELDKASLSVSAVVSDARIVVSHDERAAARAIDAATSAYVDDCAVRVAIYTANAVVPYDNVNDHTNHLKKLCDIIRETLPINLWNI